MLEIVNQGFPEKIFDYNQIGWQHFLLYTKKWEMV